MITFGRFGHKKGKEKDQEKDKENFLESLNSLFYELTNFDNSHDQTKILSEKEIITPLKKILKREENSFCNSIQFMDCVLLLFLQEWDYHIILLLKK